MATDLARDWKVDVDCGYPAAANWQPWKGITDFKPKNAEPKLQDSTDYDVTGGWTTQQKTAQEWSAEVTFMSKKVSGAYPAAHVTLRAAALEIGDDNVVPIRYYDANGEDEAYTVNANIALAPATSGYADLRSYTATLTANSGLTAITNPLA